MKNHTLKNLLLLLKNYSTSSIIVLIILLILAFLIETISTASIFPLLSYISDSNYLDDNQFFSETLIFFNLNNFNYSHNIILLCSILLFTYLLKGLIFVKLYSYQSKFIYNLSSNLSKKLYLKYLRNNFSFHINNNSSKLIQNITSEINTLTTMINQVFVILTDTLILLSILFVILYYSPFIGAISFITIGLFGGLLFYFIFKKHILKLGIDRQTFEKLTVKNILESFGGIKEIKIFNLEDFFGEKFKYSRQKVADIGGSQLFISQLPRLWIEIITVTLLVSFFIFISTNNTSIYSYFPQIGLLVSAAFRILPSSSRLFSALQTLDFSKPAINLIYNEFNDFKENNDLEKIKKVSNIFNFKISFDEKISLQNIDFKYKNSDKYIFKNLNFTIHKNSTIGIIGESGSGKSTLVDILMGLIKPKKGSYLIDNQNMKSSLKTLRNIIGYVPQSIFLIDDSIKNNIAFGIKNVDYKMLDYAIKSSGLHEFVNKSKNGVETFVGERGVKLSGGQKQRIGIARALYSNPDILIFDEATSSLDIENENKIVNTINKIQGKKTIIIITHRMSTIKNVDFIYRVKDKNIYLKNKQNNFKVSQRKKILKEKLEIQKTYLDKNLKKSSLYNSKKKALLFVGYNYLSTPLYLALKNQFIDYELIYFFTKDSIGSSTNFKNFDKKDLENDKNFVELDYDPPWFNDAFNSNLGFFKKRVIWLSYLFGFKSYKKYLKKKINEINPDILISTSDLFFSTRYFSKIKPNIPIFLIQPCYLDLWERPFLNYFSKKITNTLFPMFFEKQHYFGFEIENINILVWDMNSYKIFESNNKTVNKIINPTHIDLLNKGLSFTRKDFSSIEKQNNLKLDPNKKTISIFTAYYGDVLGHGDEYQNNLESSLVDILKKIDKKFNIIIKIHPNEKTEYWENVFGDEYLMIQKINNFDLMLVSDILISTNSYSSVEASLLGKLTINFVPGVNMISEEFCNLFNHYNSIYKYSSDDLLDYLDSDFDNLKTKIDILNSQNNILGINSFCDTYSLENIIDKKHYNL